jgi:hypothetical protein
MASEAGMFRDQRVKMAKKKQAPADGLRQFEQLMREADHPVRLIWLDQGPTDTPVRLRALYGLKGALVYVQAFIGGGWRAYTPDRETDAAAMIGDVIARCADLEGRMSQ